MNPGIPYLIVLLLMTAIGHLLMKYSVHQSGKRRILFMALAIGIFVPVPVLTYFALKTLTMAAVFLSTAVIPVITTLGGSYFFNESLGRHNWIGLTLIVSGVTLYALAA